MGQRDRYAAGQRDRYAAGQRDRYAAGRRNRYAAVASQLSRYAASDNVSGTQIRGKFCRSGREMHGEMILTKLCVREPSIPMDVRVKAFLLKGVLCRL